MFHRRESEGADCHRGSVKAAIPNHSPGQKTSGVEAYFLLNQGAVHFTVFVSHRCAFQSACSPHLFMLQMQVIKAHLAGKLKSEAAADPELDLVMHLPTAGTPIATHQIGDDRVLAQAVLTDGSWPMFVVCFPSPTAVTAAADSRRPMKAASSKDLPFVVEVSNPHKLCFDSIAGFGGAGIRMWSVPRSLVQMQRGGARPAASERA